MPWYCLVANAVVYLTSYAITRAANHDPALAYLESIPSSNGRLIVSGWFGLVRHPNYLAEMFAMMSMAMCCGRFHLSTYLYHIYLVCCPEITR